MKQRKVTFTKMSGGGNDFVVIDNRRGQVGSDGTALARSLCARKWSVGADGLLLLDASRRADFRMRYYNADGSRAAMCGNGARCLARYASLVGAAPQRMTFETDAGLVRAAVHGKEVEIGLPDPTVEQANLTVRTGGRRWEGAWIQVGVPHFVVVVPQLDHLDVARWGRALRYHRRFAPAGTNVDFIQRVAPHRSQIRTYERGVEEETLACGTGAVASAIIAGLKGLVTPPVTCRTAGGEVLTVNYRLETGEGDSARASVTRVTLRGPTVITFRGEVTL
ncbi:MAG: diaminopimelate epimerase [Elusimicrobia bacterium]|nr:diaminopimelate epimerase [Elusimicrobiota bacterium]